MVVQVWPCNNHITSLARCVRDVRLRRSCAQQARASAVAAPPSSTAQHSHHGPRARPLARFQRSGWWCRFHVRRHCDLAPHRQVRERKRAADQERRRRQRELPETPELLERRERERAADRERKRRQRKEERELPEAECLVRGRADRAAARQPGRRARRTAYVPCARRRSSVQSRLQQHIARAAEGGHTAERP
jgi:hypothetical protein